MEAERLKVLTNNNQVWKVLEEHLQEQIQKTQQALEVATSEQEMFRNQGKLVSLRQILALREQLNRNGRNN
jgi:regulator of sigma D